MKQYLFLLFVVPFITIVSCRHNKSVEATAPNLVFEYSEKQPISKIISDIEYTPLETNDSCLMGYIKQVLCYNDRFYMLDALTKSIYVFSNNGKYISKISQRGQGPGEYIIPHSIAIDKAHNMLYINDVAQSKILIFDAKSLAFVSEYFTGIEAQDFCILNDGSNIVWYGVSGINYNGELLKYHIMMSDLSNLHLKEWIPVEFSTDYILRPVSPFFQTDKSVIFSHPYKGTVYELSSKECKELFAVSFNNHKFPSVDYLKDIESKGNFIPEMYKSGYVVFFNTFSTEDSYCFNFYADNTYFMAVHNKANAHSRYYPVNVLKNNLLENIIIDDMGILFFSNPTFSDENYYYSLINLQSILNKKENYSGKIHSQLQKIINETKEDGNPIILRYRLK